MLVATPIGNLGDLAPRALETLAAADVIACEDTRRTGLLLSRHGVARPRLLVVNEHTEVERIPEVLGLIAEGRTVALVSDAGSPALSDPGQRLVAAVLDAGGAVTGVPGPSAAVMALGISGLPSGRWVFEGFLPRSGRARSVRLEELAGERRTIVLYEAPHRLGRTIDDLAAACGDERRVVLARELTKLHEELWRGTLGEARERSATDDPIGEHVIVLAGAPALEPAGDEQIGEELRILLDGGASVRSAVDEVTAALRVPRRQVYDVALRVPRLTPAGIVRIADDGTLADRPPWPRGRLLRPRSHADQRFVGVHLRRRRLAGGDDVDPPTAARR